MEAPDFFQETCIKDYMWHREVAVYSCAQTSNSQRGCAEIIQRKDC